MTDLNKIIADWRKNGTPKNARTWRWEHYDLYSDLAGVLVSDELDVVSGEFPADRANASFIAAAPDMADRIEALEAENARLRTIRKLAHDLVTRFVEGPSEDANTFGEWDALVDAFNGDNT
jgi:hypothetical protein